MQYRIKTTKNKKLKFQSKLYSITPLKKKTFIFQFSENKALRETISYNGTVMYLSMTQKSPF